MKTAQPEPTMEKLQSAFAAALARGSRSDNPTMSQIVKDSWPGIKAMMLEGFKAKEICAVFNEAGFEIDFSTFVRYLGRNGYSKKRAVQEKDEQPAQLTATPPKETVPVAVKQTEKTKPAASTKKVEGAAKVAPDGADLEKEEQERQRQTTNDDVSPVSENSEIDFAALAGNIRTDKTENGFVKMPGAVEVKTGKEMLA